MTRLPAALLILVLAVLGWSAVHPHDWPTWSAEVFPVLIALPLLVATHKKFPLTPLLYILIALHACILIVGGHYTYALTPVGDWMRDVLHTQRNPYDRLGHFVQGFVPALIIRELLIRTSPLRWGKWMAAIIFFACMGISAIYELIEWAAAEIEGAGAIAFLGTQGDVWDTQKDMAMAGIGAIACLLTMTRLHDRQLKKLMD
jgi:putative membrane protein